MTSRPTATEVKRTIDPVETHGPAGTVVLWHQKTSHIAGINRSGGTGNGVPRIRQAMIHDCPPRGR